MASYLNSNYLKFISSDFGDKIKIRPQMLNFILHKIF